MNWTTFVIIIYLAILIMICLRIIFETHSSTKTLAYLLFCIFIPVIGMIFYLTFGVNYWRNKLYSKKETQDNRLLNQLKKNVPYYEETTLKQDAVSTMEHAELAYMLIKDIKSPLTRYNKVKLLINGEEKFVELMKALEEAKHHIHMEYYIYEQGEVGNAIIELLIKKAKEGVEVRLIYDDFGSPTIKRKTEKKMMEAGIEVHPFHKVHFYLLANRFNYRNHRKMVIIDGKTGFTGGINVSDRYVNNGKNKVFWRDTHLRIDGPGVYYLQYLFMSDWNFCCSSSLKPAHLHFDEQVQQKEDTYVQIVGSGPDSKHPSILFSILQAIYLAKEEILITTPYFIPGDNIMDAVRIAASSGLTVKLLVPAVSDSRIVNKAAKANYSDLIKSGVEVYLYEKGFIHSKTMVTDGKLSIVGSANMDYRSFELNFEVNAIVYDLAFAKKLRAVFFDDLKHARKINEKTWNKRPFYHKLAERLARLFSPAL